MCRQQSACAGRLGLSELGAPGTDVRVREVGTGGFLVCSVDHSELELWCAALYSLLGVGAYHAGPSEPSCLDSSDTGPVCHQNTHQCFLQSKYCHRKGQFSSVSPPSSLYFACYFRITSFECQNCLIYRINPFWSCNELRTQVKCAQAVLKEYFNYAILTM